MEMNILDELLGNENDPFAVEATEKKVTITKETLSTLKELLEVSKQNNRLLTMLKTGLRKNNLILQNMDEQTRRGWTTKSMAINFKVKKYNSVGINRVL